MRKLTKTIGTVFIFCFYNLNVFAANLDKLIPRPGESTGTPNAGDKFSELKVVGDLPEITIEEGVATVIITVLTWSMILALIALVVAGLYYLTSRGEEETLSKAKNIIIYLLIGMLVIAGAYGLVSGLAKFNFLQ